MAVLEDLEGGVSQVVFDFQRFRRRSRTTEGPSSVALTQARRSTRFSRVPSPARRVTSEAVVSVADGVSIVRLVNSDAGNEVMKDGGTFTQRSRLRRGNVFGVNGETGGTGSSRENLTFSTSRQGKRHASPNTSASLVHAFEVRCIRSNDLMCRACLARNSGGGETPFWSLMSQRQSPARSTNMFTSSGDFARSIYVQS